MIPVSIRRDKRTGRPVLFFWNSNPRGFRRDKRTGRPVLFFWNSNPRGFWLECFDRAEGHAECSLEYMLRQCQPLGLHDSDGAELVEFWESIGPVRASVRIVARLPRPRTGADQ